jgi:hypothetical protein
VEPEQLIKKACSCKVAVAAAIALCAGWSSSALSAATAVTGCDAIDTLRTIELPVQALSVSTVDHVSIEPDPADIELLAVPDSVSETAAPLLFLTPRVASVLRGVFEVSSEIQSSPLAESDRIPDISELLDQLDQSAVADDDVDLPLFQQRMFRTDI